VSCDFYFNGNHLFSSAVSMYNQNVSDTMNLILLSSACNCSIERVTVICVLMPGSQTFTDISETCHLSFLCTQLNIGSMFFENVGNFPPGNITLHFRDSCLHSLKCYSFSIVHYYGNVLSWLTKCFLSYCIVF